MYCPKGPGESGYIHGYLGSLHGLDGWSAPIPHPARPNLCAASLHCLLAPPLLVICLSRPIPSLLLYTRYTEASHLWRLRSFLLITPFASCKAARRLALPLPCAPSDPILPEEQHPLGSSLYQRNPLSPPQSALVSLAISTVHLSPLAFPSSDTAFFSYLGTYHVHQPPVDSVGLESLRNNSQCTPT